MVCRSSPRRMESAASSQPRTPSPVVKTTSSGGAAMSAAVASRSSSSAPTGCVLITGPCRQSAPRPASSFICSSARRSAVTPIVYPASGPVTRPSLGALRFEQVSAMGTSRSRLKVFSQVDGGDADVAVDHVDRPDPHGRPTRRRGTGRWRGRSAACAVATTRRSRRRPIRSARVPTPGTFVNGSTWSIAATVPSASRNTATA